MESNPVEHLEAVTRRHFAEDYRQRTNGTWETRDGFLEHIRDLDSVVRSINIEVLEKFVLGTGYADRHVFTALKNDGSVTKQEVYVFARLDDSGRFKVVEDTTLVLTGNAGDHALGNAK